MTAIRLKGFTGAIPALDKRLLPDGAAQRAENVILTSGRLDPMSEPREIAEIRPGIVKSIYRMFDEDDASFWLSWLEDVDVARSGNASFRIFFTSDEFEPRTTDLALATSAPPYPTAWYTLGVTPPLVAATVGASGGVGAAVTRSYVYTYVVVWSDGTEDESAPSPASTELTGKVDDTWALTAIGTAPPNSGTVSAAVHAAGVVTVTVNSVFGLRAHEWVTFAGVVGMTALNASFRLLSVDTALNKVTVSLTTAQTYTSGGTWTRVTSHNIVGMVKRIYRSVTESGATDYFYVGEIPVATTTFNDTAAIIIGEPLTTRGWIMPPANLQGIHTLASGALCGFFGNTYCASEPNAPYAWPLKYRHTADYPIVGLGVFGQSAAVLTEGSPYLASGVDPESTSMVKHEQNYPCLSKRGIVELAGAVFYPTALGLAAVTGAGVVIVSERHYAQLDWRELNPETFIGAAFDNDYYAILTQDLASYILVISTQRGVSTINLQPTELYTDAGNGLLYAALPGIVVELNYPNATRLPLSFTSREYVLPFPVNFGWARIEFDAGYTAGEIAEREVENEEIRVENAVRIAAQNTGGALNGSALHTYALHGSGLRDLMDALNTTVTFTLFQNDVAVYSKTVANTEPFRLPDSSVAEMADNFFVRVSGNGKVRSVVIGDTIASLKAV